MIPVVAFVSGKYTGETEAEVEQHIIDARAIAAELWDKGYHVFCPHMNSAHLERHCKKATYDDFLGMCLWMVPYCDLMVMINNWKGSKGAKKERIVALNSNVKVYERVEDVPDAETFLNEQYSAVKEKTDEVRV